MNKILENHQLKIAMTSNEGALLRILGMVERRGYRLLNCSMQRSKDDVCSLEISVESDRPGTLLQKQLERLHDVNHAELLNPAAQPVRSINIHARA